MSMALTENLTVIAIASLPFWPVCGVVAAIWILGASA